MTEAADTEHADALRGWAKGLLPLEAATELLIRAGFAQNWRPWVHYDESAQRPWIDFESIPEQTGGMSGGERRLLRIAASLGADSPIILGDELAGLDRSMLALVLAAVAHANDAHRPGSTIIFDEAEGTPKIVATDALHSWPE